MLFCSPNKLTASMQAGKEFYFMSNANNAKSKTTKIHKRDVNFSAFEKITEKEVYQIGSLSCLIGHIVYFIIFNLLNVPVLAGYNMFSMIFYVMLTYILTKVKRRSSFIFAALAEITVFACLSIRYVGWNKGFALFLIFILPIPFFMPLKKFSVPYILSAVIISIFTVMKTYMMNVESYYTFSDSINNAMYLMNIFFGAFILIYISSIYMVNREMMHLKIKAKNESLQKLASVDPLTQLFNRRAMMDFLKIIQSYSEESGNPYVIGLGDIDDFKHINDTYGHYAGDEILRNISEILTECVPSEGYVCRWGGEEFLFAVPSANCEAGKRIAENIIEKLRSKQFTIDEQKITATMTIGICEVAAGDDFEKHIIIADNRLYAGKHNGKNQVVTKD